MTKSATAPTNHTLAQMKARADLMGIEYHPAIGLSSLTDKVSTYLVQNANKVMMTPKKGDKALNPVYENETLIERKVRKRREASRLIRIRVTCMDPNKRLWEGAIYSVGNSVVGFHKKFVPFNTEDGWHVPEIIYKHLIDRKCQTFVTKKNDRGGKIRVGRLIPELSIEVLDPLTPVEIKDLQIRQAQANNLT